MAQLPGPPLTLSNLQISRGVENAAELAAFRAGVLSLEVAHKSHGLFLAPISLVPKSRFPETETVVAETGSIVALLSGESQHLALA